MRLVVDMRRSGINGLMALRERVILPRVSDVAESVHALFLKNNRSPNCEFFISDFKDAFYALPLKTSERKYAVVKGGPSTFYVIHVVSFGFACGPVLWCRLAACSNRIVQASVSDFEGRVQTYVDDPIMVACAPTKFERSRIFCRYTLLWCILGFEIAWHKCSRGASVCWIGVMLQLLPSGLKVMLCPEKTERLRGMFQELRRHGNMIPTQTLQTAAGVLGWIANLIPAARPWASMLWAAVHASQASHTPAKLNTRVRKGLTFRKQVEHALHWLESMLTATVGSGPQLERVYMWNEHAPVLELYTDACPTGLGGVLYSVLKPVAYFSHQLTLEDAKLLGAQLGDPAFQSEFELYSVLVAVLVFQDFLVRGKSQCLAQGKAQVWLRSDNTSTVQASTEYKTKSPFLTYLAAELAVQIEGHSITPIKGRHIMGVLNTVADQLSRNIVPTELASVERRFVTDAVRATCKVLPKRCD